jgi:hypothetical protein
MVIVVTLNLPEDFHEEELDSLKEAIEDECRFSGGSSVVVEVHR